MSCGTFRASPPGHSNLLLPRPRPGVRTPGAARTEAGGRGDSGAANYSSSGPSRSLTPTRLRAPPPLPGWVRTAERGRRKKNGQKKGCGVGAAWAPGLRSRCNSCPSPAALRKVRKELPQLPAALCPLLRSRRCAPGSAPRPDGLGFHHPPLALPHKPVTRALPRAGVAPKGEGRARGWRVPPCQLRAPLPSSHDPFSRTRHPLPGRAESAPLRAPSSGGRRVEPCGRGART